jgi:hypothetical protein
VGPATRHPGSRPQPCASPGVAAVGGWWNRRFDPEIDEIDAARSPAVWYVYFNGSIK